MNLLSTIGFHNGTKTIKASQKEYLHDGITQASHELQTMRYCFKPHKVLDGW